MTITKSLEIHHDQATNESIYFLDTPPKPSEFLGHKLSLASISGKIQPRGILIPSGQVVWTTDPKIDRHSTLAKAEDTITYAQFQSNKRDHQLPTLYISSRTKERLISLTKYLMLCEPTALMPVLLTIIGFSNNTLFTGNVLRLKQQLRQLENS